MQYIFFLFIESFWQVFEYGNWNIRIFHMVYSSTLIIIIPVACDIEAIEPDTKKTIFFGILIINKGALSVAANINTPKMMACILGAMLKLLPEAA